MKGKEYAIDLGGCCPRRVTVLDVDDKYVYFQTKDLVKHKMGIEDFNLISYPVG